MGGFIPWLRNGANMRTASLVAAAESLKARLDASKLAGNEQPAAGRGRSRPCRALQRADEPGELLAYWPSRHGRNSPSRSSAASPTPSAPLHRAHPAQVRHRVARLPVRRRHQARPRRPRPATVAGGAVRVRPGPAATRENRSRSRIARSGRTCAAARSERKTRAVPARP